MSTAEMQACLTRLYVDQTFRRLLAVDEEHALDSYALTAAERSSLLAMDRQMLELFASMVRAKRRGRMATAFPRLFQRGGSALERYFDRFHQLFIARPNEPLNQDSLDFIGFVHECFLGDDSEPHWVSDLALYERLLFEVNTGAAGPADPPDERPVGPGSCLALSPGVAYGTFRSHVLEVVRALDEGLDPSSAAQGEHVFVIRGTDAFYITEVTRDLLDRCDGHTPISELAQEQSAAHAALLTMVESKILRPVRARVLTYQVDHREAHEATVITEPGEAH
jgi:hypothetical protein